MSGGVYLIKDDDRLVEMTEAPFKSEEILQELLEKYPNLLAGDQMNNESPREWLLVSRETPIPSEQGGGNRWSIDHFFLDQDAIPTIVEVKRSEDTRIRREVVGQILDYAANAVANLPVERIQSLFEKNCTENNFEPEKILAEFIGPNTAPDKFWQEVQTNLQAGKIRLVFVADKIPPELHGIVEFLNKQMHPAEVLAVEIKQYVGESQKTLIPRVLGITAESNQIKSAAKRKWDEKSFFEELEKRWGSEDADVARKVLKWGKKNMLKIWWGEGKKNGSFIPVIDHNDQWYTLIGAWTSGGIEIQFQILKNRTPFKDESRRMEFRNRLNKIQGIDIPEDGIDRRPSVSLSVLQDKTAMKNFIKVLDWALEEIKSS